MGMGFQETFVSSAEDSTALTNTTTATSILPASRKITLPAQFWDRPGKMLRIFAAGRISTVVTTPGTLTLDVRFGSTVVFNGGAMALNVTAQTNATWRLLVTLVCRTIGSGTSATVLGTAEWKTRAIVGSPAAGSGGPGNLLLPDTAPAAGSGFDSTASQTVDLFGTWSVASASNSILTHQFSIDSDT